MIILTISDRNFFQLKMPFYPKRLLRQSARQDAAGKIDRKNKERTVVKQAKVRGLLDGCPPRCWNRMGSQNIE